MRDRKRFDSANVKQLTTMWTQISTGFDGETVNFGPREEYEGKNSLYEVQTLATISPTDKNVLKNPKVVCLSSPQFVAIAVDSHLAIFSGECDRVISTLSFESDVNCLAWDKDSLILLVGENNGRFHISCAPFFTVPVSIPLSCDEEADPVPCRAIKLLPSDESDLTKVLILDESNMLHVFWNLNVQKLLDAVQNEDWTTVSQLKSSWKKTFHEISRRQCNTGSMWCGKNSLVETIIAGDGEHVRLWKNFDKTDEVDMVSFSDIQIKKLIALNSCKYLFALDYEGALALVCLRTFNMIDIWKKGTVVDFEVLETSDGKRVVDCHLALIVNVDDVRYFELRSFPNSELLYSLVVAPFSILVQPSLLNDDLFIVEGVSPEESEFVDLLRIRTIVKMDPEFRLTQLLHKRMFSEAESLALTFSMDLQMLYKVKVNYLLQSLSPWYIDSLSKHEMSELRTEMMGCLDKILDTNYVAEICLRIASPTLHEARSVLVYAQESLKKNGEKLTDNGFGANFNLTSKVHNMLQRLETFDQAFRESQFSDAWNNFCVCNLKEEMLSWLRRSELSIGFIIWDRHKGEFIKNEKEVVCQLLSELPGAISIMDLIPWLRQSLLPTVLQLCPADLDVVAGWMIDKVKKLELTEKEQWPSNAISFLEVFPEACEQLSDKTLSTDSLNFTSQLALSSLQKKAVGDANCNIPLLLQLICYLKELLHLKTAFNCKLTLSEIYESDKLVVAFSILDSLPKVENIPLVISSCLAQFARKHNLSIDEILESYIMNLLKISTHNWWHWEEPPWQAVVLVIVECITRLDIRMNCVVKVAEQAPVPWSEPIVQLVDKSLSIKHQSNFFLNKQKTLVGLKTVLAKFGLHRYPICDKDNAEWLMSYILRQDRESVIADAMEVVNFYEHLSLIDVYNYRLRHIVSNFDVTKLSAFLMEIPPELLENCYERLLHFTVILLEEESSFTEILKNNQETMKFCEASLFMHRVLENRLSLQEHIPLIHDLEKIFNLQKEFGFFVSLDIINDKQQMIDLFDKLLNEFKSCEVKQRANYDNERKVKPSAEKITPLKFLRLGALLGLSREESISRSIQNCAISKEFKSVVTMCDDLCSEVELSEFGAEILYNTLCELCYCFPDDLSHSMGFTPAFASLMSKIVTFCSKDLLPLALGQSRWSAFAFLSYNQSDKWERSLNQQILSKDSYQEWTFTSVYEDIVLRMKHSEVLPFIFEIANICRPLGSDDITTIVKMVTELKQATMKLIGYFSKKSQDLLLYSGLLSSINFISYLTCSYIPRMSVEDQQQYQEQFKQLQDCRNQTEMLLLKKLFSMEEPDYELGLGLLLGMARKNALSSVKTISAQYGSDYSKQKVIAALGIQLCEVLELPDEIIQQFVGLCIRAEWGQKLAALELSFTEAFATNQHQFLQKALNDLVAHPKVDITLIEEYCVVFEFDVDAAVQDFLQSILSSVNSSSDIVDVNAVLEKASNVDTSKLDDVQLLQLYQNVFNKSDSYCYEIIQFTLEKLIYLSDGPPEMRETSKKGLKLLEFLKMYDRINQPTEEEIDYWSKHQSSISDMPKISSERLPFHMLNSQYSMWKVITPQLNLMTIDLWLSIAEILKLPRNQLMVMTVQNVMHEWLKTHGTTEESYSSPDENILDNINHLIGKVTNPEMATACANLVMQRLPKGKHKVKAALIAKSFAQEWVAAAQDKKASDAYSKMCNTYSKLATTQLLIDYQLDSAENLHLASRPVKLIMNLLENIEVGQFICNSSIDIFRACEEIAEVNHCHLNKICMKMVSTWLPPPQTLPENPLDQTINFQLELATVSESKNDGRKQQEQDIRKAIYVLQQGCNQNEKLVYLQQVAFSDSPSITQAQRYQALRCLISVADENNVADLTKKSTPELRQHLESLLCVSQLEHLHLPYSVEDFNQSNKSELVETILHSHPNKKSALDLACSLCIHYGLHLPRLWDAIFQQMSSCGVQLDDIIPRVMNFSQLCHCRPFINVLNNLLKSPFTGVSVPLSSTQVNQCYLSLRLILRCPVLQGIDISGLFGLFMKVEMWACALACILRLQENPALKNESVQRLIHEVQPKEVLENLQELNKTYKCDTTILLNVRQAIYRFIDTEQEYQQIYHTRYLGGFVNYLLKQDSVENLLKFLIKQNRYDDAVKLINLYKVNSNQVPTSTSSLDTLKIVQSFIDEKGIDVKLEVLDDQ